MNRRDAKRIAETVTHSQLSAMFENARLSISDWSVASSINPSLSLGAVWNIMYPTFRDSKTLWPIHTLNMVWAFGDYLDDSLKPARVKRRPKPAIRHEDPVF